MKNSYISLAVLSMAAFLVSCQNREFNEEMYVPEEGDVVFAMPKKAVATKASDATIKGVKIDLGTVEGNNLFLEETITNLDEVVYAGPETKGTPAYTENLGVLYANNLGVHADAGSFGENTYDNVESTMINGGTDFGWGWRFKYKYATDPWPGNDNVGFYLRMPAVMSKTVDEATVGVTTDLTEAAPYSDGSITFQYTSPSTAEDMQDILFGYRSTNKNEYQQKFLPNGIPVLLRHALTGVKFAIANYDATKNITIKSVTFKGLYDTGTCTITPVQDTESNGPDDIDEFTSAAAASWNLENSTRSQTPYSSGTFGAPVNFSGSTTTTDEETGEEVKTNGSFTNNGEYPDSFAAAGNTNNLNDANATQTFWLIPQAVTSDVTLEITYTFGKDKDNNVIERTETLEFGRVLTENGHTTVWHAGELHTYTIRVDEVNVKIADNVSISGPTPISVEGADEGETLDSYSGSTKTNVVITNTGNTDVYIRAAFIGQWLDEESDDPVFGYTDFTSGEFKFVDSWYQDQFITKSGASSPSRQQGTFSGLVGYDVTSSNYWEKHLDGYYYYKYVVPADNGTIPGAYKTVSNGKATDVSAPTNPASVYQPLFISYTVGTAPAAAVSGEVRQIYFQLEIATQAISAKKADGSYYTMEEAWAKANTPDPSL